MLLNDMLEIPGIRTSSRMTSSPRGPLLCLALLLLTGGVAMAQGGQGNEPGDTTLTDHLAVVSRAPGAPEGSIFAGFENNENVSMFNGNLLVNHPSSAVLPIDGGGSISMVRTYSSKNVNPV